MGGHNSFLRALDNFQVWTIAAPCADAASGEMTVSNPPQHGTLEFDAATSDATHFNYHYSPTDEYAGDDSFTVRYEDNDGNEYFIQYDLVIHAYNDEVASIISPSSTNVAMTEGQPVDIELTIQDADGLSNLIQNPAGLTSNISPLIDCSAASIQDLGNNQIQVVYSCTSDEDFAHFGNNLTFGIPAFTLSLDFLDDQDHEESVNFSYTLENVQDPTHFQIPHESLSGGTILGANAVSATSGSRPSHHRSHGRRGGDVRLVDQRPRWSK